jgi:hypothetical protein
MSSRLLLGLSIVIAAVLPLATEHLNPWTPRVVGMAAVPGPMLKQDTLAFAIVRFV